MAFRDLPWGLPPTFRGRPWPSVTFHDLPTQVPPEAHRTTPGAALEPGKEVSAHGGAEGHGGAHHGAHRHGPLALLRKLCSADGDNEPGGRLLLVLPSLVQIVLVLMCLLQASTLL